MRNYKLQSKAIIDEVFEQYRDLKIGFETAVYWETLRTTYERTIQDITELTDRQYPKGPIRVLEIGSFCGIVSTALKVASARFEVTAWDLPLFQRDPVLGVHYRGIRYSSGSR